MFMEKQTEGAEQATPALGPQEPGHEKPSWAIGTSTVDEEGGLEKGSCISDTKLRVARRDGRDKTYLVRLWEVLYVVLPSGCYAFGGPAGVAVFYELFVKRHHWFTDGEFADLLALGNALPGPNTSIMATAVGVYRAGALGGLVAFLAWSLPSLIIMVAAGMGLASMHGDRPPAWMSGLAPAAVVLVFMAFWRLSGSIVKDRVGAAITLFSAVIALLVQDDPSLPAMTLTWLLPVLLVGGGLITLAQEYVQRRLAARKAKAMDVEDPEAPAQPEPACDEEMKEEQPTYESVPIPRYLSIVVVMLVLAVLASPAMTTAAHVTLDPAMELFSRLFLVGITIYGGGQVILPALISVAVKPHWLSMEQFMEGFAFVQMLPGPLYNIAGYIGAVYMGLKGAVAAWLGLNLPGVLLVLALLPLWDRLRRLSAVKTFLSGVNCAGLGLILSVGVSLYLQVVTNPASAVVTVVTAAAVGYLELSSLVGVIVGGIVGFILSSQLLNIGQ